MTQKKFVLLYFLVFLFLWKAKTAQAQTDNSRSKVETSTLTKNEKRKQIPKYLGIAFGNNYSKFRDFATSPLFYNGKVKQVTLSRLKNSDHREVELRLSYDFGSYSTGFNENTTTSDVKRVELNYTQLYRIGLFNSETINTKIGFLLQGNGNLRANSALQNNGTGIDIFANLLGAIKITKDISRRAAKEGKLLFWKVKLNERKRNLAFRLNLGLVNSSYRNGFAYSDQSAILNESRILDGYEFKMFSGFRTSSSLDYTHYLKNKNAVQFSYVWDAYSTGGDLDKFEMAHHTIKLTLLFNTNNR